MTSYEVITNQIIEKLNEGIIPWVKPWKTDGWKADGKNVSLFPAFSYSNGKRYNFMNQMLLGFQAGEYATFEQIKKAGGKVKKGEKSSIVAGWIVETKPQEDKDGNVITDEDGNELTKTTFALRYYRVFNILTQVEGLTPKHDWEKVELPENNQETSDEAEKIIKGYLSRVDAPKFEVIKGSNEAYYAPALDLVRVPHISQYDSISEYYGTIFHEFTHSTGSEKRLNRKLVGMSAKGKEDYSKEELIAEIGSCFLNSHAGLNNEDYMRNSTAYIQGWLKALKDDPKMIIQASAQAEKATEYILDAPETTNDPEDKGSKVDKTNTNVKKAFDFIVKSATKNHTPWKTGKISNVKYNDDLVSIAYTTDGYQVLRTLENIECDALDPIDHIKYEKIMSSASGADVQTKKATLGITLKELKEGVKTAKNGKRSAKVVYTTKEGITLNARFLENALLATGATEYSYENAKKPVVFRNETTTYILLPIHSKNEHEDEGFKVID